MYKCIHGLAPSRLCNNIEMVCERHDVRTRNYNTLNVVPPKPNIECFKKCFMFSAAQVWNKLPDSLKNAVSVNSFKLSYKKCTFDLHEYFEHNRLSSFFSTLFTHIPIPFR